MIASAPEAWILSVLFGLLAAFYLAAAVLDAEFGCCRAGGRWGALLHAVMAGGMIPMVWTWGVHVPPIVFILVFTAAALWFLARGLFTPALAGKSFWYHAAMMASMVWMAVVMASMSSTMPSGGGPDAMSMSGGEMAGMSMPGPLPASSAMPVPGWSQAGSIVAAVLFGTAALVLLLRSARLFLEHARSGPVSADTAATVMAAGMCAAFVAMV